MENLEIKIFQDGDKLCALLGDNIQEGTAGFGTDPYEALHELINELQAGENWRPD